jgi:hypothetical protein
LSAPAAALRLSLINLRRLGLIVNYVPATMGGTLAMAGGAEWTGSLVSAT